MPEQTSVHHNAYARHLERSSSPSKAFDGDDLKGYAGGVPDEYSPTSREQQQKRAKSMILGLFLGFIVVAFFGVFWLVPAWTEVAAPSGNWSISGFARSLGGVRIFGTKKPAGLKNNVHTGGMLIPAHAQGHYQMTYGGGGGENKGNAGAHAFSAMAYGQSLDVETLLNMRNSPCGDREATIRALVGQAEQGYQRWNNVMRELPDVAMEVGAKAEVCKAGKRHFVQALTYIERGSTVALVLATARALRGLVYIAVHRQVLDISNLARAEAREINALGKITDNKSAFERETAITSVALLKVCTHHWAAMSNERVNPTVGVMFDRSMRRLGQTYIIELAFEAYVRGLWKVDASVAIAKAVDEIPPAHFFEKNLMIIGDVSNELAYHARPNEQAKMGENEISTVALVSNARGLLKISEFIRAASRSVGAFLLDFRTAATELAELAEATAERAREDDIWDQDKENDVVDGALRNQRVNPFIMDADLLLVNARELPGCGGSFSDGLVWEAVRLVQEFKEARKHAPKPPRQPKIINDQVRLETNGTAVRAKIVEMDATDVWNITEYQHVEIPVSELKALMDAAHRAHRLPSDEDIASGLDWSDGEDSKDDETKI